ncbi:MAG: UbiA family prenyltransferase [Sphingomonadaceae bacterium]
MFHDINLSKAVPLVVDLDGSLTSADIAVESLFRCLAGKVSGRARMIGHLPGGTAAIKTWLARVDPVDPRSLPLREEVLDLIARARAEGRPVILASAAHQRQVDRVADHLRLFDHAIGTTSARSNNKGANKLARIRSLIGDAPFDYVGDSSADLPIWREARIAYTVGVTTRAANEQRLVPGTRNSPTALARAARPHQWAKNLLVFVPLVTAGLLTDIDAIAQAVIAFLCMSFLASGTYLLNDLLDIDADRAHSSKCKRPLAAGELSIPFALLSAAIAIVGSLAVMMLATGYAGFLALTLYLVMTLAYSLRLKSAMIVDVIALAGLYTLRLVVGAAAIGVAVSFWLFLFSTFFFLSLGYVKRYVELSKSEVDRHALLKGRGYVGSDAEIVMVSGISAGMVSLLIIALFANDMRTSDIYQTPSLLWLLVVPLLYWLNRIWMMARRGQVDGDPVAFAMKDKRSWVLFSSVGAIILAAKFMVSPF